MAISRSKGNMYDFVSHTHTHLRGKCSHGCKYCYVQAMEARYGGGHYAGDLRLSEKEFQCSYDTPAIRREALESGFDHPIFFIEHCNDLFAKDVPAEWIERVFAQCRKFTEVEFVFQSKNAQRLLEFEFTMPLKTILGTTIESDIDHDIYGLNVQPVLSRLDSIGNIIGTSKTFVTIEPILRMRDPSAFALAIADANPSFVNIGADSKGTGLPEPSKQQVLELIDALRANGVTIRKKVNLERLLK